MLFSAFVDAADGGVGGGGGANDCGGGREYGSAGTVWCWRPRWTGNGCAAVMFCSARGEGAAGARRTHLVKYLTVHTL